MDLDIQMTDCAASITENEIVSVMDTSSDIFVYFIQFYKKYNGGFPEPNLFYLEEEDMDIFIAGFYPIKYQTEKLGKTIEEVNERAKFKGLISGNHLIFGYDEGGNYLTIKVSTGEVFLVYMDLGTPKENDEFYTKLADNFLIFVDEIQDEDYDEVIEQ